MWYQILAYDYEIVKLHVFTFVKDIDAQSYDFHILSLTRCYFDSLHLDGQKAPVHYMDLREGDMMQPAAVSPTKAVMPYVNAVIGTNARQMALDRFAPQSKLYYCDVPSWV